ncbi:glycoside hydrolase family protein [Burkholderia multivorans]|uniref:glycoside hydrolase family protein n=1 Tax=Burkholderia multivorans TaxID=87883 RepID=UPI003F58EBD8
MQQVALYRIRFIRRRYRPTAAALRCSLAESYGGYNPGGGWTKVTDMINRGQIPEAMAQISQYVYSGGKVFDGLVKRRKDEVTLYTTGRYEFHGQSIQHKK